MRAPSEATVRPPPLRSLLAATLLTACDPSPDSGLGDWAEALEASCSVRGLTVAAIEPGSFTMGSPEGEVEEPTGWETQHRVTLGTPFELGTREVTQAQFEACLGYQPSEFTDCGHHCPVESLSWHEAALFANALSRGARLEPCYLCDAVAGELVCSSAGDPYACPGYRLPTEAEWEYAARAGTTTAFGMGDDLGEEGEYVCNGAVVLANGTLLGEYAWYCANSGHHTRATADRKANAWGLLDTMGNVYEWCHDGFDAYDGDATDPLGPDGGDRVIRGGAFDEPASRLRSAFRTNAEPQRQHANLGLRIARSAP